MIKTRTHEMNTEEESKMLQSRGRANIYGYRILETKSEVSKRNKFLFCFCLCCKLFSFSNIQSSLFFHSFTISATTSAIKHQDERHVCVCVCLCVCVEFFPSSTVTRFCTVAVIQNDGQDRAGRGRRFVPFCHHKTFRL